MMIDLSAFVFHCLCVGAVGQIASLLQSSCISSQIQQTNQPSYLLIVINIISLITTEIDQDRSSRATKNRDLHTVYQSLGISPVLFTTFLTGTRHVLFTCPYYYSSTAFSLIIHLKTYVLVVEKKYSDMDKTIEI